jgi:hypothetical protein
MIIIGIDDTDTKTSRGTGHLARVIASALAGKHRVAGVTRHQLLQDPRVPYTAKNSSAAIHIDADSTTMDLLAARVQEIMRQHYIEGSDPGLCLADPVASDIIQFGQRAQQHLVTQEEARSLAKRHGLWLRGLGGTEDGVIGALAAVGLAATGNDGRYITVGHIRELEGLLPVDAILQAGVSAVQTQAGLPVQEGLIRAWKLRPARRGGKPILYVVPRENHWEALKGVHPRDPHQEKGP